MATRVKKAAVKKKKWIEILTPPYAGNASLGEAYVADPATLVGKTVKTNLMTLLNDPKRRRYTLSFRITEVEGQKAKTEPYLFQIQPSSMKAMIRKNKDRVDYRFRVKSQDGKVAIVKPLVITRNNTTKALHTELRKAAEKGLKERAAKLDMKDFVTSMLQNRIQKEMKKELDKIYPVQLFEFRVFKIQ